MSVINLQKNNKAHVQNSAKKVVAFENNYPNFCAALLENYDAPELEYTRAYASFMCELIRWRGDRTGAGSKQFFSLSYTHAMLSYRLLSGAGDAIVSHHSPRIGVTLENLREYMKSAEQKGYDTINGIISDAVKAGYVEKTHLGSDKRRTVYFLSKLALREWLEFGVHINARMARQANLSDALRKLADALDANNQKHSDQLAKILDAPDDIK